jgi:hypothetical protein
MHKYSPFLPNIPPSYASCILNQPRCHIFLTCHAMPLHLRFCPAVRHVPDISVAVMPHVYETTTLRFRSAERSGRMIWTKSAPPPSPAESHQRQPRIRHISGRLQMPRQQIIFSLADVSASVNISRLLNCCSAASLDFSWCHRLNMLFFRSLAYVAGRAWHTPGRPGWTSSFLAVACWSAMDVIYSNI